ncbi:type II toxin-antitoxin system Phd/YefM family antitoxin [Streptacidiphilus fuscans]|uniref:Antitoxin n=1 Tax=Streptacidiphilus fuscans TaxID=2789292 RepID=A0A931BB23_9ACTN|nr:type II toxin-antitoxin system Phd/YefM family antitoxin [Streptacidiphilus fuscans]MBF9073929.1 type II toxin-antitoxin system Phd/YefM family antitoxin [Streptacidiphilus fuscans]
MEAAATLPIREARAHFGEVIDRATHDESIIITRHGKEVAAVVPIELLRQYRIWEEQEDLRLVREAMKDDGPSKSLAEMMAETLTRK